MNELAEIFLDRWGVVQGPSNVLVFARWQHRNGRAIKQDSSDCPAQLIRLPVEDFLVYAVC